MAAGKFMGKVSEKVSFATKVPILLKSTSDDDTPTPFHLYQEINKITYDSLANCQSLLDFLSDRLKKSSPLVKFKALRIMTYISANGQSEFRSALRHKDHIIRNAASFTGAADPLHGDALNQKVRKAATDLIELLFNVENPESTQQSFAMAGPTGRKMDGFGNTPVQNTKSDSLMDSVKNIAKRLPAFGGVLRANPDNAEDLIGCGTFDRQFISVGGKEAARPPAVPSSIQFVNHGDLSSTESRLSDAWGNGRLSSDGGDDDDANTDANQSVGTQDDLTPESRLVNDVTAEGGVRSVPSRESLQQFTKRCSTLDLDRILELLNLRLEELTTEVQMKALYAIEHLLKSGLPDVTFKVLQHCTNLHHLSTTESANLKAKANKILLIAKSQNLSEKSAKESHSNKVSAPAVSTNTVDLLHVSAAATIKTGPVLDLLSSDERRSREDTPDVADIFQGLRLSHGAELQSKTPPPDSSVLAELDLLDTVGSAYTGRQAQREGNAMDIFDPLHGDFTADSTCCSSFGNNSSLTVPDILEVDASKIQNARSISPINAQPVLIPATSMAWTSSTVSCQTGLTMTGQTSLSSLAQTQQRPVFQNNLTTGYQRTDRTLSNQSGQNIQTGQTGLTGIAPMRPVLSHQAKYGAVNPAHRTSVTGLAGHTGFQPIAGARMSTPLSQIATAQPQVNMSTRSTVPIRLPKPSTQKTDFDFISKPKREEAFSFVQDEIKASKK